MRNFAAAKKAFILAMSDYRNVTPVVIRRKVDGAISYSANEFANEALAIKPVGNLLLATAPTRESEIALRASLGASRGRLIRLFLVETSVLAASGCVSGCLLAYLGIKAIVLMIPCNAFPQEAAINLSSKVLLFSL
jgi:FtsX-like permease family